ncbi:MAG: hypothetical protein ACR2KK_02015 [Acidimicrobiales bacterium]
MGTAGPAATLDLQVTGAGGVPASGVSAVMLNVTARRSTGSSFLTAWRTGEPRPLAADPLCGPGKNVPSLVWSRVAGGRSSLYNHAGTTNLGADVAGWYNSE